MTDGVYYNEPGKEAEMGSPGGEASNNAYKNFTRYGTLKYAIVG